MKCLLKKYILVCVIVSRADEKKYIKKGAQYGPLINQIRWKSYKCEQRIGIKRKKTRENVDSSSNPHSIFEDTV